MKDVPVHIAFASLPHFITDSGWGEIVLIGHAVGSALHHFVHTMSGWGEIVV